jgi:hypothetical protein
MAYHDIIRKINSQEMEVVLQKLSSLILAAENKKRRELKWPATM